MEERCIAHLSDKAEKLLRLGDSGLSGCKETYNFSSPYTASFRLSMFEGRYKQNVANCGTRSTAGSEHTEAY